MKYKVAGLLVGLGLMTGILQSGVLAGLTSTRYLPHLYCYLAQPWLVWSNLVTDSLIAVSYVFIFLALFWLAASLRSLPQMRQYLFVFIAFGIFILACGATHVMESVTIWLPIYRVAVLFKVICAAASVATAILLIIQTPSLSSGIRRFFKLLEDEHRVADELRKSQSFLDRTNRLAGVGGWEVDLPSGKILWSAETYRIHGHPISYEPSMASGIAHFAPAAQPIISAAVQRGLDTGEGWDLELEFVRADGARSFVRTVGSAEIVDSKPVRLIGAIQDKTQQIEARLALERANQKITIATQSGGIGIWEWDIRKDEIFVDRRICAVYSLVADPDPTALRSWIKFIRTEDRLRVTRAFRRSMSENTPLETEYQIVAKDGALRHVKVTGKVTVELDGSPLLMVGTLRDVTESRKLAIDLARQNELLRITLLSIGEGVVAKDIDRRIVGFNDAAERMTGWTAADALGKPANEVFTLLYEGSRSAADIHVSYESRQSRVVDMSERILLIARDGSERNIESYASPIFDARNEFLGSVIVFRDVTERYRLARESEQITKLQLDLKLKDEFLSHVSHELRSPLTSVYSFTSIVADNLAGETTDEQQQYLQIVLKNVLQLQAMIEDLLTVTQSKEGKLPIETEEVRVASVILDAVNTSHPAAVAKSISIASMDFSEVPAVRADPTRLRQILIILLDNAIKFTPEGGHIDIRVVEDGTMLRFEVEDNGCGIALEKRARVFEKLYQIIGPDYADTCLSGRIGLGLGLHIARDLVHRQGGNIWVTGAPERGSIFAFTLPIASQASESGTADNPTPRRRKTDWPENASKELSPAG